MVLTYKTLHGTTPVYICDMLNWYHPARSLRSGAFLILTPNRHKPSIILVVVSVILLQQRFGTTCQSSFDAQTHYLHSRENEKRIFLSLKLIYFI